MPGKTIVTLDLEASSLDETGYPIEVACVLGNPSGITGQFSTFIRPRSSWRAAQHWSPASAAIHGIAFDRLSDGLDADVVCDLLDRMLGGLLVSVDGGTYDEFWLARLYNGRPMAFALDHLAVILSR